MNSGTGGLTGGAHAIQQASERSPAWSISMWAVALLVATLPVVFCLYQVWIFFDEAFPHMYWSRTLPALAAVGLGLAGIALPLWVALRRKSFRKWTDARALVTLLAVAAVAVVVYLIPFLSLVDLSRTSPAILPYTPSVHLTFDADDGDQPFRFGVVGGTGTGHGNSRGDVGRFERRWSAPLAPRDVAPNRDVTMRCESVSQGGELRIDVEIDTPQTVTFHLHGLDEARVTFRGEEAPLPARLDPGAHRLQIVAPIPGSNART